MFVFEVIDTEAMPDAKPLPSEFENSLGVKKRIARSELRLTIENVCVAESHAGSQRADSIQAVPAAGSQMSKRNMGMREKESM